MNENNKPKTRTRTRKDYGLKSVALSEQTLARLKEYANARGLKLRAIATQIIDEYLERQNDQKL